MPDKRIILTGVAQGVGEYLGEQLFNKGYTIIGIDLPAKENLKPEASRFMAAYYSFDLSRLEDIPSLVIRIVKEQGPVDILINNAGVKSFRKFEDYRDAEFRQVHAVNFLAPVLLTRSLLPYFNERGSGKIINIGSNAGFEGYSKGTAYCSSKGALHLFSQALSQELRNGVTINAIAPETIATQAFIAEKKIKASDFVQPAEVLALVLRITESKVNGKIFPLISKKMRLKYFMKSIGQLLK